jgi:hypothetical protein
MAATRERYASAVDAEGPGSGRMKLIRALGRWVRSLRRVIPRGISISDACVRGKDLGRVVVDEG